MDQVDVAAPLEEPFGQVEDVAPRATPAGLGDHQHLDRPTAPGRCDPGHASVHGRTVGSGPGPSAGRSGVKPGTRERRLPTGFPPGWNENGFRARDAS